MNIAVLGAGNVAWHLSKAFIKAGYPVKQIWNRTEAKAVDLALEIGADSITDLSLINEDIGLVVLAVSDEAIERTAASLKLHDNQILVHTAGSASIDMIKPYATKTGVIYPLQTFSKNVQIDFSDIPVFIEGNTNETTNRLIPIVEKLTQKVQYADSRQRIKLHIAAVFACNFTNHFYAIAQQLLTTSGLDYEYIKPLIQETVNKALKGNPAELQTGPARRNDVTTMSKHLEILAGNPEWQQLYQLISQNIVKMYDQSHSK